MESEERKLVTLLFADVTGSTALGEQLDPERLRALLHVYFGAMRSAIEGWGGTVEKFIGDAVMAAFGVPQVREDDAERALRAALEMLGRLEDLNRGFAAQHGVTLAIRIGVNTGEVIAPVGAARDELIVAGDAVNVAARLEQSAEPGTVLAGERTYLVARHAFRFGPPRDLEVKGKAGTVRARQVLGLDTGAGRDSGELHAAMVGRDRELGTLVGLLDDAVDRARPQLVLLYGPAGIGKSRLVQEFVARAHDDRPIRLLRGRCLPAGQGITYWACAEILRAACGISLDEPAETARLKLQTSLTVTLALLDLPEADVQRTIQALALTAGISLPGNPLERLEPRAVADELAQAWPRFASALGAAGPTILVVEDLHWAVEQMLEMLERLLARSEGPVLLVATARPEFAETHPGFAAGREDVTSISLRPLTEQQSAQLVEGLLATPTLPEHVRGEILARAEGNPFFLEEILRRLIDEAVLVREEAGWRFIGTLGATTLPDTIHALLAARIDGLPVEEKRVLQEAAVIGRIFWAEPVRRAAGNSMVDTALLDLEGKGLIVARPTSAMAGHREYAFRHALVRDVAYAGLPKARRARSNAVVGAWVEELAADRVDEFIELIAHYYGTAATGEGADLAWSDDLAGREAVRGKAFEAKMRAGAAARRRSALAKAVELHRDALALAADDAERLRAHEAIGDDERAAFHGDESWAAYGEALLFARSLRDRTAIARVAGHGAVMAAMFGPFRRPPDPADVHALVEEGLAATNDPALRARLLYARSATSTLWLRMGGTDSIPPETRIADAEEASRLARELGDVELESLVEESLMEFHDARGDHAAVLEASRRQVRMLDRIESPTRRAMILFQAAQTEQGIAGDHETAMALARRSYEIARDLSPHELMHATATMITLAYLSGRWEEIPPLLAEHMQAFQGESERACGMIALGPAVAALADVARGDEDGARGLLAIVPMTAGLGILARATVAHALVALGEPEEARRVAEEVNADDARFAWAWVALLEALVNLADWDSVDEALPRARALAGGDIVATPLADRAEGRRKLAAQDAREGERLLRAALAGFERLGIPFEAARTREVLAGLADAPEREDLLRSALETYQSLGATPHAQRVRASQEGIATGGT